MLNGVGSRCQARQMLWKGVFQRSALRCLAKLPWHPGADGAAPVLPSKPRPCEFPSEGGFGTCSIYEQGQSFNKASTENRKDRTDCWTDTDFWTGLNPLVTPRPRGST